MGEYTKRTCVECGIRRPQPEMIKKEKMVKTGNSKTGVSTATFIGAALGNKKSTRSVGSWLFNAGQRSYNRKRQVWLCPSCAGYSDKPLGPIGKTISIIFNLAVLAGSLYVGLLLVSYVDKL